jgi:bifunctional DNA-binding transcriptional regulator/antitoxin component of YhaV-PrlF toxin-antitoxin module
MITNMTQKRQVTIAKEICDAEGLAPGRPVRVERFADGGVLLRPAVADDETRERQRATYRARIAAVRRHSGRAPEYAGCTTDEIMDGLREPLA